MNPVAATIAATAAAKATDRVIESDTTKKLVNIVLIGAGGFLAYKIGKKIVDNARKDDAQSRAGEDPHVRVAMGLRNAINPSGAGWMMSFDTTNLGKLYEYAGQITNLSAVQSAYRDLYGGNLMDDLKSELNNEEYQKLMTLATSNNNLVNLVDSGNTTLTAVRYAKPLEVIVAKTNLNVRSSPNAGYSGKVWEALEPNKNIVRSVKKGDFIGFATGRQEFDVKNNVKFIEVGFKLNNPTLPSNLKNAFGKFNGEVRHWVSSSANYVDRFSDAVKATATYPALKTVLSYILPPAIAPALKGVGVSERKPSVLAITGAMVLNENMQAIGKVQPNVLLGECLMVLQAPKGKSMVKFRTVQGMERWIDKRYIKIIHI